VGDGELSRANGLLNMLTNIAIIAGIVIAGPVSDGFYPMKGDQPDPTRTPLLWLPGVVLVAIAVCGLLCVLVMPRLSACDPKLRCVFNPVTTYVKALKEMAQGPLMIIAFAWSFFYLVGMMALLILPEYKTFLQLNGQVIDFTQNSYLFATLAVSIGVGSLLAGVISGRHIRPGLTVIGAVGMTVSFVVLGLLPANYWLVAAMLLIAGIFAGFYIVPLQALLQKLSPDDERGRFLGTANALSFVFSSLGAVIYWVSANVMTPAGWKTGDPPVRYDRIFLVCGVLAILATGYAIYRLRDMLREHKKV
jgi:MFS family permease